MSAQPFGDTLLRYYRGEMSGEESFTPLLEKYTTPYQQYFLGTALQLETETKARIRPLAHSMGLPIHESEQARIDGRGITRDIDGLDWQQMVETMTKALKHFVGMFQDMHDQAPEDWKEFTYSMVIHELALLKAFQMEAAGQSDGALDDIIRQLKYPLIPPPDLFRHR